MKMLAKYNRNLDKLDVKIVRLFEQRMCTVKKIANYKAIHDLLPKEKRKKPLEIVKKTIEAACDTEIIAYTEGLITYILTAGEKFYRYTKNNRK